VVIVTVVLILLLAAIAVGALFLDPDGRARRAERRVLQDVQQAELQVSQALTEAQRAMNTAAGQSWRNPFE
jgi:Flp pilus assembly protein TadB